MLEKKRLYWQFTGSICLLLFIFLGYCVKFYNHASWLTTFDSKTAHLIQSFRPTGNAFFAFFTFLGNPMTVIIITTGFIIYFLIKKQRIEAAYLALTTIVFAGGLNFLLKQVFMRPRPVPHYYIDATGYSFPSGHADGSVLLYATLLLIFFRTLKKHQLQWLTSIIVIFIILMIGCSRVYFNVHYPTDIIGGWALGCGLLFLTYPIFCHRRFIYEFKGGHR